MADFPFAGVGIPGQQVGSRHDHTGGTKAALQPVHLMESFLKGVQLSIGHSFNRGDAGAVCLNRKHGTRFDRLSIHMNSAGAATTGIATDMGAREPQGIAQVMHQQQAWFYFVLMVFAIDFNMDFVAHIYAV